MIREQIGCHSFRWDKPGESALISPVWQPILLQKSRICEVSSCGNEEQPNANLLGSGVRRVLEERPIREAGEIPTRITAGRPEFPGDEPWLV